jgi:hypothetical protein|tara:strand:- start:94 stop:564 length:471 start_codon:yes stop_codon:yes gene_type:complete
MLDPVTALATASAAFNVIKRGFSAGRDLESMSKDLSRWMGACSDIKKADEFAKKPPLFKKLFAAGSVEEDALQSFMAKKKSEDMRIELRNLISMTRGPSAWKELVETEGRIRKARQQAIYDQEERQREFFEMIAISAAVIVSIGLVGFMIWLYWQA